jgi:hypothetical protein
MRKPRRKTVTPPPTHATISPSQGFPVPFLFIGIITLGWAGFSLATGKGYYKGCPPGGYDRALDPFRFWAPTLIILAIGVCMILIFLGVIPLAVAALELLR